MPDISLSESIQTLLKKKHLLSAKEILQHFEKKGRSYNKTSVYRALDQLYADEVVCRYDFKDSEAQYELRSEHHDHFVCEECGDVESIECQLKKTVKLKEQNVSHHHLTLFGTCQKCA